MADLAAFTTATSFPLKSIATIDPGRVLIVAPHPDDETLGCGGAIALLRSHHYPVQVLVVSDGTMSHPRSRKFPAPILRQLREQETINALRILGVESENVRFLRLPDSLIENHIDLAIVQVRTYLQATVPTTIFLPWRCDPHPDHRATWQLFDRAIESLSFSPRIIEYPIWDWDPEQRGTVATTAKVIGWRLDTAEVGTLKQNAIAQYRSQTTDLINDDPEGFRLTAELLSNFAQPWELFFEEI
ncbi:PIG-L deacetylase family protein [Leptolyngbya sp. NIES-2104]|uniref:PIG-L deacetylase family protein n=1 Tax=Leptolyngbya sp. NIES-2104 TaxID=1552121 RepID=UPI0006ECA47E|nr:PIG-L deacetylase family protein [Leptolyngbya sp. NIES-2104]GAP98764.1 LmbE-like protein [Leptolyngbya sp. NIES-2104]